MLRVAGRFTPNADWNGTVDLTYDVTDGTDSTSATASFDVLAINDAPFSVIKFLRIMGFRRLRSTINISMEVITPLLKVPPGKKRKPMLKI